MVFEGNALDREMTVKVLRENGWNVTIKSVVVRYAVSGYPFKTHTGGKVCRIDQIDDLDDDPNNYLNVINLDSDPEIGYGMFASLERKKCSVLGSDGCFCMIGTWEIEVLKVDMRQWS